MRTFVVLILLLVSGIASGQEKLQILSPDKEPRKMLYGFLQAEAQKHFDVRKKLVAALKNPEDIRKRQGELRAKFLEAIGSFPEKTPLNARVVGTLKGVGFHVEKVIYESRPNHHVTANFYIPHSNGPFPPPPFPLGPSSTGTSPS